MSSDIQRKMGHGALWMVLFKFTERSLGLISTLILVHVLSPIDFGITAMAGSFILMTEMLTAFSFDVALIQKQDATDEHYHSAWTCNVLLGLAITVLMLAAATWIADFYKHPELYWVVCALALGPLISGSENIGVVAFRKDMRFRREFAFQLSRKVIGVLVVVPLAFYLRNYWALVAGVLASKLVGTITSYLVHPFRPHLSLTKVRGLLGFSKWLLVNNFVNFLKERSSDFVIGRLLGAVPLGVYNISYEIALMPTSELSAPINRALLPGFSRIAHDSDAIRAAYRSAVGVLALIAVPVAFGIYAVAPHLIPTLLGPKWLAAVPLIEILAFNGGLQLLQSSICTVIIASGRPDRVTKTNGLYVLALLILFALLVPSYGLSGAAYGVLVTSILSTPIYLSQLRRSVGVTPMVFLGAAARPVVAALAMALLVRWVLPEWSPAMDLAVSIGWTIGGVTLGVFAYAAAIMLLWLAAGRPAGAERLVFEGLRQRFLKRGAAPASIS
ncbi:MAG TPA: lipopolysaccharide biosynthesis protein [Xanthobacteraceae bacterium]|nr:lipopolysaccharide biosynthesis protein [Xanthobacteraceae bacterium]